MSVKAIDLNKAKTITLTVENKNGDVDIITDIHVRPFLNHLGHLAEHGERMRWTDGKPPAFGPDERKWIIFEYLTPYLRSKSYVTTLWLGKYYSDERAKLARRWMLLPEPPAENDRPDKSPKVNAASNWLSSRFEAVK